MGGFNHIYINRLVEDYQSTNKRVTIDDLANLIGIAKATLDKVRKGVVEPKAGTLYLIAVFFDVSVNDFFDYDQNRKLKELPAMVSSPFPEYGNIDDPWRIAYEQQKEITDLKLQLERSLNENALGQSANAV
ncbi:MAG: helix-turn-helix transcriptional regulator [Sedimentibacter sp.]